MIKPNPGWYIEIQIRVITEEGKTYGAKKETGKNQLAGIARLARSASPRAIRIKSGTTRGVNKTECHSELQKSGSAKSSR